MRRSKVIRSTAPEISSATETCGPVSDSEHYPPSSSTSLSSVHAEAVLSGFRAHSGGLVLFVGDSIAEELAKYLRDQLGMKEVLWCTKPGASPADIMSHLRYLLTVPDNVVLFNKAVLLIVCAGTNLARSTPSLIAEEVHQRLIIPLNSLLACRKIIIGPITREHFESVVVDTGIQGVPSSGTTRGDRRGGASPSMLHQANLELERRSLDSGCTFVNLFNGHLSATDFRDNLHLNAAGYLKMLRTVLEVMGGELHDASSTSIESSLGSHAPSVASADAHSAVPVACASEHPLSRAPSAAQVAVQGVQHGRGQSSSAQPASRPASTRPIQVPQARKPRARHGSRDTLSARGGKHDVPPTLFDAPVKRKRDEQNRLALAASPSSFNQPGQLDHADVSSTPCALPPLSLEGLISQRHERIQQQRAESESIEADLSKRMRPW